MAEAIECAYATLGARFDASEQSGANFAFNAQGVKYQTALPQRR